MIGLRARAFVTRLLRVTTYASCVTVALGVIAAKTVHAEVKSGASAFGEQLLALANANETSSDAAHELELNGQRVHVSVVTTSLPLADVLARFQRSCEEHADGMATDLADLDAALARPASNEGFPGVGVLRDDRSARGVVACFATGETSDPTTLAVRLERFSRSHDLGDLGRLRYVAARTTESGRTQVVATWTDGAMPLDAMFPSRGDATGNDPKIAPRPEGARRLLSAADVRAPYGVFVYQTTATTQRSSAAAALAAYETRARADGFTSDPVVAAEAPRSRAFERDGVDVIVTAEDGDGDADEGAIVSVVEMPSPHAGRRAVSSRKVDR